MELRAIVYSVFSVLLSIANVESRGPQQVTYVKCKKFIYHISFYLEYYFLDSGNLWISFKASKCTS